MDFNNIVKRELIYYPIVEDWVAAYWSKSSMELESISLKSLNRTTHHNIILNEHSSEITILRSKGFLKFEDIIIK